MKYCAYILTSDPAVSVEFSALSSHAGFETIVFSSGGAFLDLFRELTRGVAVIDMNLPDDSALGIMAMLQREKFYHVPIGTSDQPDVRLAVAAMRTGAVHFLHRPLISGELGAALHEAQLKLGEISSTNDRRTAARALIDSLTTRQREVLRGLVSGERNLAMAERLGLSARTIETYRKNMMTRLGADSVAEAVRIGLDGGIEPVPAQPADAPFGTTD